MMLLHRTGRPESSVKSMEAPSSGLDSFWGSDNSLATAGFPPSDYLHDNDTAYDMFLNSQNIAGPADWTRELSSFSDQVNRADAQDLFSAMPSAFPLATDPMVTDPYYCPSPPPALATNVSSPWTLGGNVGDSTPDTAEPAFTAAPLALGAQKKRKTSVVEEEDAASPALASPTTSMPTTRTKRKASTTVRTQPKRASAAKAPSVSSCMSSASSSESSHGESAASSSTRRSISGHGGNHNITLRTASRKPKPLPAIKTEGDSRQGGGGKKQQSPGGGPPLLSSTNGGGGGGGGGGVYANGQSNISNSNTDSININNDNLTSEERRARQNHNVVEKQYRNRLNSQFEKLLAILPANERDSPAGGSTSTASASAARGGNSNGSGNGGSGGNGGAAVVCDDRRMSKAEVLELARRRIHALEQERLQLRAERQKLLESATVMQQVALRQQQQQQQHALGGSL